MSWIQTYTGRQVHVPPESPNEICLEDIAHHLANICRFRGACSSFYSVAEHSVRVARAIAMGFVGNSPRENNTNLLRWALLHDAHEAYLGDTPRPVKRDLLVYEDGGTNRWSPAEIERIFDEAIADALGLETLLAKEADLIKRADAVLLATEARDLMAAPPAPWEWLPPPLDEAWLSLGPLSPVQARELFMESAEELGLIEDPLTGAP